MLGIPQVSRTLSISIECTSFPRFCMGLSKHHGLGYVMGSVNKTPFTLKHGTDFLLVQIYVDDIIFGGSSHTLVSKF
jgi:hypothetical protein